MRGKSVKCLTLDFGSGHDLTVHGAEPHVGLCTDSEEPAWDSCSLSFSVKIKKHVKKETNEREHC